MKTIFLETKDDLNWLRDVHGVEISGCECAILYGNEDAPRKVETYTNNHGDCKPVTWIADETGTLKRS